ncbi:MAG: ABC transporter permease [Anaerolineae bacterium]
MTYLMRALGAETRKMNRTLALLLTLVAPGVVALLQFCMLMQNPNRVIDPTGSSWESTMRSVMVLWSLLMLPLFVTLETALTAGLDHNSRTWKWLFALPIPRWAYYAAKLLVNVGLIGLSTAIMAAVAPLVGLGLRLFRPGSGFEPAVPWAFIWGNAALVFVASLLIVSLHTWAGMRWPSFVVAVTIGIVATFCAVNVVNSEYVNEYPWTLAGYAIMVLDDVGIVWETLLLSAGGAALVGILGCWDFCRQDAS